MQYVDGKLIRDMDEKSIPKTCLQIGKIVGKLHTNGVMHGDLTTSNFILTKKNLFLIDFGLAKRYKSVQNVHIRENADKRLTGTARYASINSHHRMELSRRDDLESIGNVLIYFAKGGVLPWMQYESKSNRY